MMWNWQDRFYFTEPGDGGGAYTAIPIIITTCRNGNVVTSYRDNGDGTYSRVDSGGGLSTSAGTPIGLLLALTKAS